jgi:hypothetical protein
VLPQLLLLYNPSCPVRTAIESIQQGQQSALGGSRPNPILAHIVGQNKRTIHPTRWVFKENWKIPKRLGIYPKVSIGVHFSA